MANSHITISGLDDQFVSVINSSINYYVSTTGSDNNNGSSDSPWRTVAKAFSALRDKKISKTATVTINIADVGTLESDYQESEIVVDHPDGDRINLVGQAPQSLSVRGYNYYQTAPGLSMGGVAYTNNLGATAHGYILEIAVTSNANIALGDIAVIREQNYTPSGIGAITVGVTGAGPTAFETDLGGSGDMFMATGQNGTSGATMQGASVSLRKFLAVGAHEILATGGNSNNPTILVHVRHDNHTYESGLTGGATKTDGFVTPQGIAYLTPVSTIGIPSGTYKGHKLRTNNASDGVTILTASDTPGASGAVPFPGAQAVLGLTACGRAYEGSSTIPNLGSVAGQRFNNIGTIEVYRTRLNFDNGNGFVVKQGGRLGKIKNVAILGKGFDLSGGTYEFISGMTGSGVAVYDSGCCNLENVAIAGFDYGVYTDASKVYGTGIVSSSNNYGLYSTNMSSVSADYCLWTGNSFGVSLYSSDLDSHYNIYSANQNDGVEMRNNSNANIHRSVSVFNGRNGFHVRGHSHLNMGGATGEYTGNSREGATSDFAQVFEEGNHSGASFAAIFTSVNRFGTSQRDGCIAFRNASYGIHVEDSSGVETNSNRISFNVIGGAKVSNQSYLKSVFGNFYNNGVTQEAGDDVNGLTTDGIRVEQRSVLELLDSGVIHHRRGIILKDASSAEIQNTNILSNYIQIGCITKNNLGISGCTFEYEGLTGTTTGLGAVNITAHLDNTILVTGTTFGKGGITLDTTSGMYLDTYSDGSTGASSTYEPNTAGITLATTPAPLL